MFCSLLLAAALSTATRAATFGQWCGKYYQVGAPMPTSRPEGSLFPYPSYSDTPLLDFRCVAASSLYLVADDANDPPKILIDANITHDVGQSWYGDESGNLTVEVWVDNWQPITTGSIQVGSLGSLLPFSTTNLTASTQAYNLTCKASINGQEYWANSTLRYFPPNPHGGNTVKIDRRSGSLVVRNETGGSDAWERLIPFGFYDNYQGSSGTQMYNDTLKRLYDAKQYGFNFIHPVAPNSNSTPWPDWEGFLHYLDVAEQLGIWIMYDMRYTWTNTSSVTEQVTALRNRSNILLWYTGDEPDGAMDPLNSTGITYDLINTLDGYRPVSLVLNCENYYFIQYGLDGSDLLLVDPYPIALNGAWSKRYNTPVNVNFGDSGCDNCNGTFYDITERIDSSIDRARTQGKYRTTPVWMVPQAFDDGQQEFWYRVPTGDEEAVQTVIAFNHGAMGHCAWNSEYSTPDILSNASFIAEQLYAQSRFIIDAHDSRQTVYSNLSYPGINGVDLASWTIYHSENNTHETFVMGSNFNYIASGKFTTFSLANVTGTVKEVLFGNVTQAEDGSALFSLPRTSVAGVILQH